MNDPALSLSTHTRLQALSYRAQRIAQGASEKVQA